jgi:biopolymer transport protein ExbD
MPIKKKKKDAPAITTASLPDIVFMLLCFFMVVTKMRDADVKVRTIVPQATELQKLEKKTLVSNMWIGVPSKQYQDQLGTAPRIQLADQFATIEDIPAWVAKERAKVLPVQHPEMSVALKVDAETKMGILVDVKNELRKQNYRKVTYLASKRSDAK